MPMLPSAAALSTPSSHPSFASNSPKSTKTTTTMMWKPSTASTRWIADSFGRPRLLLVTAMLVFGMMPTPGDALDCYQCGMYNDGVGSITHCLNYSEALAHRYLRKCPRDSDNFCIKYVSELSIVRDCVAKCKEKEVWETRTYCCNEDGCNPAARTSTAVGGLLVVGATVTLIFTAFLH